MVRRTPTIFCTSGSQPRACCSTIYIDSIRSLLVAWMLSGTNMLERLMMRWPQTRHSVDTKQDLVVVLDPTLKRRSKSHGPTQPPSDLLAAQAVPDDTDILRGKIPAGTSFDRVSEDACIRWIFPAVRPESRVYQGVISSPTRPQPLRSSLCLLT